THASADSLFCLMRRRPPRSRPFPYTTLFRSAGKGKGGKVAQLATAFERSGLHNVDNVSTISRSMMNKAIEKGVAADNIIFFPNWSEIARFQHVADADVDALRNQLGLADNKKIILYSGNIGEKQGLENVIEAAD